MPSNRQIDGEPLRVLSYNLNMLPRGTSGGSFQEERIGNFVKQVVSGDYSVLLLQEVFSASILPDVAQRLLCFQRKLIDSLELVGFKHVAMPRQPSYASMMRYGMTTDTGLLILSKHPITCRGSYTFRSTTRGEQRALKGCLYSKILLPQKQELLVFNVHLKLGKPHVHRGEVCATDDENSSRATVHGGKDSEEMHLDQLVNFVHMVIEQHGGSACPFLFGGNLNFDAVGTDGISHSKQLQSLLHRLEHPPVVSGTLRDLLFEKFGRHFPTRPPRLFFQARAELVPTEYDRPRTQDYLFLGNDRHTPAAAPLLRCTNAHLEKFLAPPLRPFVYLSDHFGVSAEIHFLQPTSGTACKHSVTRSQRGATADEPSLSLRHAMLWWSQTAPDRSPYTLWILELLGMLFMLCFTFRMLPWSEVILPFVALLFSLRWILGNTLVPESIASVTSAALIASGTAPVETATEVDSDCHEPVIRCQSVWQLWEQAVEKHRWSKCLSQRSLDAGILFDPEWIHFGQADARIRDFGSGLLGFGICRGETIGIMSGSNRRAIIADLACLGYGITSVSLAGSPAVIRQILDSRGIRAVICGRSAVLPLLECRSRNLRFLITLQPCEYDEEALAKDVNVELIKYESIEGRGKLNSISPCPFVGGESPYTLILESHGSPQGPAAVASHKIDVLEFTQHDVLRAIDSLHRTGVLAASQEGDKKDLFVWQTPFSSLFQRIFALAMLLNGDCVACSENMRLQDSLRYFQPTILVAQPSLFYASEAHFRMNQRKWTRLYRYLFMTVYAFRSQLIHSHHRDSSSLRWLFFRSFQRQIGGKVRKLILSVTDTSTPFSLHEFIAVCYTPCIREVFFSQQSGIFAVDGASAPNTILKLDTCSTAQCETGLSAASIGRLMVSMKSLHPPGFQGPWKNYDIAATWTNSSLPAKQLLLLGPVDALLWPVDYLYACAVELEREYSQSRFVFDIFVTCENGKPLVAVVHPNKELIEWEWRNQFPRMADKQLGWTELVSFATPLILNDLEHIATDRKFHPSHVVAAIHMHPHAFSEHSDFMTPHGRLRRHRLSEYFQRYVQRIYGLRGNLQTTGRVGASTGSHSIRSASPDMTDSRTNSEMHLDKLMPSPPLETPPNVAPPPQSDVCTLKPTLELKVPVAVDIGGTMAKVVYLRPPGSSSLPSFVQREFSSLERAMTPDLRFFTEECLKNSTHSDSEYVGELCFAKLESKLVPEFVKYLQGSHVAEKYKKEHVASVRATGGGAFKYAPLIQSELGVRLRVVKEMDSVVCGLNLLLRIAPESIFTVDCETGSPLPHKLERCIESPHPFLIVNIGSGISIVKCSSSDGSYERVGGSAIGGATFWGLVRTMTKVQTWDEVLEITRVDGPGDNTNVDLLVGDIYGFNAKELPNMLSVDTVASTFGKLGTDRFCRTSAHVRRPSLSLSDDDHFDDMRQNDTPPATKSDSSLVDDSHSQAPTTVPGGLRVGARDSTPAASAASFGGTAVSPIDIVRSLLIMIANNVTQLAYLHCRTEGITRVFFTGGFVRDNPIVWRQISKSIGYWSKGQLHAHFLAHDGYLGALGTATMELPATRE